MHTYVETTEDITVSVSPVYLDGQSDPMRRRFVFAYFVRIQNNGSHPVQLLRRRWIIQDGSGDLREVEGEGVVGRQPVIPPGRAHAYNSFCILEAFEGSMSGSYRMRRETGEEFEVQIPRFTLRAAAN
ncbi:MAG: Co2+/Mg2+ efflux protein ApaG [Bacteroidota bacterium]